jgi:DNA-binding NtrC family response regulator
LENIVEQLVILSSKNRVDVDDLPATVVARKRQASPAMPLELRDGGGLDLPQALEQLEFRLIEEALRLAKGKKSAAAELLHVKRTTLVAKLRRRKPPLTVRDAQNQPRLYPVPKNGAGLDEPISGARPLLRRAQ